MIVPIPTPSAKAMPPLWQYFSRLLKPVERILAPKERGPPDLRLFPCKPTAFRGPSEGP
jgi:hypothetical protein